MSILTGISICSLVRASTGFPKSSELVLPWPVELSARTRTTGLCQSPERLYLNESSEGRPYLILHLIGDKQKGVSSSAIGAIVRVTADTDGDSNTPDSVQSRQLLGAGGHSGKHNETIIHIGLGDATHATKIEIQWPGGNQTPTELGNLRPGRYLITQADPVPQLLSR